MRVPIDYGLDRAEFEVSDDGLIADMKSPTALADPAAAVRAALEEPHAFPALHRALTPDDHITIVLDEELPHLAELLVPVLEHIRSAGVAPESMTLLCPPSSSRQAWIEDLPDDFQDVHVEVSDPDDRRRMAYLATTHKGKRLYLNRTLVESEQVVVLSGRCYDPLLGYGGAEGSLYPGAERSGNANGDEPTRQPGPRRRRRRGQCDARRPRRRGCWASLLRAGDRVRGRWRRPGGGRNDGSQPRGRGACSIFIGGESCRGWPISSSPA